MKIKKKQRALLIAAAAVFMVAFIVPGFNTRLTVRNYRVETDDVIAKIALISDLHSCRYDDEQKELFNEILLQNPDIVVLCGDIFDDKLPDDNAELFIDKISQLDNIFIKNVSCYYVTGNHEYWAGETAFNEKMAILDKYGVKRLSGETETIAVDGGAVNICGVDDPDASMIGAGGYDTLEEQLKAVSSEADNGNYTILLSHRPEEIERYAKYGFDLVLAGHAHGGQWRIPGLMNGFYAPNQGFFPEYAGGEYHFGSTTMIVSRGLARESTRLPRFYNRPELVIITLVRSGFIGCIL